MLKRAAALGQRSRDVLQEAEDTLHRDLRNLDDETPRRSNRDVQVTIFVATQMHLVAIEDAGVVATMSLGLSLGEYAHVTHIGGLGRADTLRLVDTRGDLYDGGPPGKMVAVFPMSFEELAEVIASVLQGEGSAGAVVEIVNVNSPTQHVIAGQREQVDRVLAVLEREHFVQTVVIDDRIPMHSSLFEPVAHRFRTHLESAPWGKVRLPYRPNVEGRVVEDPSAADFSDRLARHVHRPVQWRASVERCISECPDVVFVEVGPGRILSNLLQKRWVPNVRMATDSGDDLRASIDGIARKLGHA